MKHHPTIFDEDIISTWWELMGDGIADGAIKAGEDYTIQDGMLYITYGPLHAAYVHRFVAKGIRRELLLSPAQMRRMLTGRTDYLFDQRKRLSKKVNAWVMVFLWNKQVRLPARKLRKVG